jgi:quercetin dioxygenase-like cupin family protein
MVKTHLCVTKSLDVFPLQKELLTNLDEFDKYDYRRTFPNSPHAQMNDIWARYNDVRPFEAKGSLEGFETEHDSIWYPVIDKIPSVKNVVFDLMRIVDGERLGGVLITKLPPGGHIARHTDAGWHAQYYDKFYVPILNAKGSTFGFDDGIIDPDLGDAWWFDNSNPHWVDNKSDTDRIAMIVCIRTEMFKDKNAHRI